MSAPARRPAEDRRRLRRRATALLALLPLAAGAAAAAPRPQGRFSLTYPGRSWALVVDLPGFRMRRRPDDGDRSVVATGSHRATGMRATIVLEPAAKEGDALACRRHYWRLARRSPIDKTGVVFREAGDLAIVEYEMEEYGGVSLRRKTVSAFLAHDGIWIGIHLSRPDHDPADGERFDRVLRTVRVVERTRRR